MITLGVTSYLLGSDVIVLMMWRRRLDLSAKILQFQARGMVTFGGANYSLGPGSVVSVVSSSSWGMGI